MRIGEGVEWSLHVCTVLGLLPPDDALPTRRLAELFGLRPTYLAKHLQALARAGVVESVPGRGGGYRLARAPHETTMLDVVLAVEGDEAAFSCTEIRRNTPFDVPASAFALPCGVARAMWAAEDAWRAELRRRTIADLMAAAAVGFTPETFEQAAAWFQEGTS
jgi:Rrf2 family protein